MTYLPISLNLNKQSILIVGGGNVALQKIKTLEQYTSTFTVLAPDILDEIQQRATQNKSIQCYKRSYSKKDLKGYTLVYICTDDSDLNQNILQDAKELHCITQVADNPTSGDFISSAVFRSQNPDNPWTVAVSSGGTEVKKAIYWRNQIRDFLMQHFDWKPLNKNSSNTKVSQ